MRLWRQHIRRRMLRRADASAGAMGAVGSPRAVSYQVRKLQEAGGRQSKVMLPSVAHWHVGAKFV